MERRYELRLEEMLAQAEVPLELTRGLLGGSRRSLSRMRKHPASPSNGNMRQST